MVTQDFTVATHRSSEMRAGVALGDITPDVGVELGGYPYFDRANTGVHDTLFAGALYLHDDAGHDALLLVTDLFWISRRQAETVRRQVSETTGIHADSVIITCSHTHSAPNMIPLFDPLPGPPPYHGPVDEHYVASTVDTLTQLGVTAMRDTFEAEVGFALGNCGHGDGIGGNRRDPENGVTDTDLPVLAIRDSSGTLRAIWTKYALHPTILHGENTLVSADFPAAMRTTVADACPDAIFLYSMGTAGDQSPRYYREGQTFDEVERFGHVLGKAVTRAVESLRWLSEPSIATGCRVVDLPLKKYGTPEEMANLVRVARENEQSVLASGGTYTEAQTANLWSLGADWDLANSLLQADGRIQKRYDLSAPHTVHALVIADIGYAFLPGEVFCDFGLEIKRGSPLAQTHVITLSNGDLPGYCVTRDAIAEGGYEPGNSILAAESGHIMAAAALDLFSELATN